MKPKFNEYLTKIRGYVFELIGVEPTFHMEFDIYETDSPRILWVCIQHEPSTWNEAKGIAESIDNLLPVTHTPSKTIRAKVRFKVSAPSEETT